MDPEITVIIPTRNRVAILNESLQHLFGALKDIEAEVIIVNDGDPTVHILKQSYPSVTIINNPGSGVASARNAGAKKAVSPVILFLDDDMWMSSEAMRGIIRFHNKGKCAALNVNWIYPDEMQVRLHNTAFGRYLSRHQFDSLKGWNKDTPGWNDEVCFRTSGITSQNLSMPASCFLKTGGYNEKFPHAGFEDYDFGKKLVSLDIPIFIEPRLMTFHNEADRISLPAWMARRQRGAQTQRIAVMQGYTELGLIHSPLKTRVLKLIIGIRPLLHILVSNNLVDRQKWLDTFTFRMFDALFAAAIFEGYHSRSVKEKVQVNLA